MGEGRGLFRNGPLARDLDDCLLHILHPEEGMSCAPGSAWNFGNGKQRRALSGLYPMPCAPGVHTLPISQNSPKYNKFYYDTSRARFLEKVTNQRYLTSP